MVEPRPRHVAISTGRLPNDVEAIAAELGNGIVITNNWYTRFQNIKEGVFSTVVRDVALLVRNGRLSARVRGLRIADSFRTLLRNFVDSSRELGRSIGGTRHYLVRRHTY
ncbi:metallopeptidase TldD-related protein [Vulcanisaeta sp. JCM 16161]|uniref:metallopeptidase TldD-related protein n=1 Tax=Vulcanisaeta sp. JCM 16161 TaxID=1295372 RepID=UPI001FB21F40|nr:metallopeptidase TldD-related protein [Vulcanisaeta sp. JCM 16161]